MPSNKEPSTFYPDSRFRILSRRGRDMLAQDDWGDLFVIYAGTPPLFVRISQEDAEDYWAYSS